MNLMNSTLLTEDTGVPFDELQAEQMRVFRDTWAEQGWSRTPDKIAEELASDAAAAEALA